MGTTARTTGAYQSSFRARVLPEILNVVDDPRLTTFAGHELLGAYKVDDEGVPAQAVTIVEHGKLTNYLISRTPIRDFATSNGHGRAAPRRTRQRQPRRHPVQSRHPRSTTCTPSSSPWPRNRAATSTRSKPWAAKLTPRLLYRVHPDGTRQLVRGAVFDELDNRSLRSDIVAAGDDPYVENTLGNIPDDHHRPQPPLRRHRRKTRHRRAAKAPLLHAAAIALK